MATNRTIKHWVAPLGALAFLAAGCSVDGPQADPIDTQVDGEKFASLTIADDRLTGVFVKGDQALSFDVDRRNGVPALRLSTTAGDLLYSVEATSGGAVTRVGKSYESFFPVTGMGANANPAQRNQSPAGFQAAGDLNAAFDSLKSTPVVLLPSLAAALGRIGLDGSHAPIALPLQMTAMNLTRVLGLEVDQHVLQASNEMVAKKDPGLSPASADPSLSGAGNSKIEALVPTTPICPSGRHPPCPAGTAAPTSGPFAGCCVAQPPPPPVMPIENTDQSRTANCSSGVARQIFSTLMFDPCRDGCRGMCGSDCSPWYSICGDSAVHAACWNHDSAYCPATLGSFLGIPIPNLDYGPCMIEYGLYSTYIFTDTALVGWCANTSAADTATTPWSGLWTHVPGFFVRYQ